MATVMTALAILMWIALGAAIALLGVVFRGRRLWKLESERGSAEFGAWLDRECEVLEGNGEWRRCRVVAASHKGAIAVRDATDTSGRHAKWIAKDEVPERVRWVKGGCDDEQ